jgi:hypothetical protein
LLTRLAFGLIVKRAGLQRLRHNAGIARRQSSHRSGRILQDGKKHTYPTEKPAKFARLPCPDVTGQMDRPRAITVQGFQSAAALGTVGMAGISV